MAYSAVPTRTTADANSAADINQLQENIGVITPIGVLIPYTSETLPAGGIYQWAEGGSLVRASYTVLRDLYIVSRGAVTMTLGADAVFTLNAHGFGTASCVSLTTTGALYTGLAINTNYYVIYVNANTFKLATTADLARAGTAITTSGSESGVHTLYSNPHGINGADSFYLPDGDGAVMKQTGDMVINGRTKSAPALGAVEEDRGQQITGRIGYDGTSFPVGSLSDGCFTTVARGGTPARPSLTTGAAEYFSFDSANSTGARTGTTTRENSMGVKYIVRVI